MGAFLFFFFTIKLQYNVFVSYSFVSVSIQDALMVVGFELFIIGRLFAYFDLAFFASYIYPGLCYVVYLGWRIGYLVFLCLILTTPE